MSGTRSRREGGGRAGELPANMPRRPDGSVKPPAMVIESELAMFRETAAMLSEMGLAWPSDALSLALFVALLRRFDELKKITWDQPVKKGYQLVWNSDRTQVINAFQLPAYKEMYELHDRLQKWLIELGLTPVSRTKARIIPLGSSGGPGASHLASPIPIKRGRTRISKSVSTPTEFVGILQEAMQSRGADRHADYPGPGWQPSDFPASAVREHTGADQSAGSGAGAGGASGDAADEQPDTTGGEAGDASAAE